MFLNNILAHNAFQTIPIFGLAFLQSPCRRNGGWIGMDSRVINCRPIERIILFVARQRPGGTFEGPIPGRRLSPFDRTMPQGWRPLLKTSLKRKRCIRRSGINGYLIGCFSMNVHPRHCSPVVNASSTRSLSACFWSPFTSKSRLPQPKTDIRLASMPCRTRYS